MNAWKDKRRSHDAAIYLFGALEREIQIYARSNGLSPRELAGDVAELLLTQTLGEVLGPADNLPALRRNGTAGNQPLEQVEVAGGAHRGTQVKEPHWTQLPENRKQMMRTVENMRLARAKEAAPTRRYKRTAKQMAAARRNAKLGRAAYMANVKERQKRLAKLNAGRSHA